MTGFTTLQDSGMVNIVLDQLERNPDARLMNSAVRYLRGQDRNLKKIAERIYSLLTRSEGLFPYQQAHFFMTLRYVREIPIDVWKEARRVIGLKKTHWYVREQAAILLGLKKLNGRELKSICKLFEREEIPEVKRSWGHALSQLPKGQLIEIARKMVFSTEPNIQQLGRFYYGLIQEENLAQDQVNSIFNDYREDILLNRLFEVEVISKTNSARVKTNLLKKLKANVRNIRRPILKERAQVIINRLERDRGQI